MVFLTVVLIAGLFSPPAQSQGVGAQPLSAVSESVSVEWVAYPPDTICLGSRVALNFTYTIFSYAPAGKGQFKPVANRPGTMGTLFIKTNLGMITPSSWRLEGAKGSATVTANYDATQVGKGSIEFNTPNMSLSFTRADFEVVKCFLNVSIDASDDVENASAEVDSELYGNGAISIDDSGVLTGDGEYEYTLAVTYDPPQGTTCDKVENSISITDFSASGTASLPMASMDIQFSPIKIQPVVVKCADRTGRKINTTLIPGGTIDPNPELDIGTLSFDLRQPETEFNFPFGKGQGTIYLIDREGEAPSNACLFQSC